MDLTSAAWLTVMLVFGRLSGLMLSLPVVSSAGVPRGVGILMCLPITVLVAPGVPMLEGEPSLSALTLAFAFETGLGAGLGLVVQILFTAITFAADLASSQTGMAMAQQIDPVTRSTTSIHSRLASLLAGAVFLGLGLHLEMLMLVAVSFQLVPPGGAGVPWGSLPGLMALGGRLFALAVQLGGPILALVWMINVFVGVLAKLAPRMNVFFSVGMTLSSVIGIAVFALALPMMLDAHMGALRGAIEHAVGMVLDLRP